MPAGPPVAIQQSRRILPFFIACCCFLIVMEWLAVSTSKNPNVINDFRQFYSSGVLVRTDRANLYDLTRQKQVQDTLISRQDLVLPGVHPSYEALFFAPFTLLQYRTAYLTFVAFNVLLLVAAFFAARPIFSTRIPWLEPQPGLIFFLFIPLILAIWQGQDSVLFLLICCCTWRQLERGRPLSAGCILALGFFRFHLAIPIAILIALRKGWRFFAGFVAVSAAIAALCVAITGWAGTLAMVRVMRAFTLSGDQGAATQHILGIFPLLMPNLRGLLYACGIGHLSPHLSFAILAVVSLALFLWSAFRVRGARGDAAVFSIAILCTVLTSDHLYIHDATLLLLPMVLLAHQAPRLLLGTIYVLPAVLFLFGQTRWFCLLAIPTLALLYYASKIEPQSAMTPAPSPLYT